MLEQTSINQRIAEMVNYFTKGNKSAFAKAVGISNQSLGEIIGARQSAPSFAALQKILAAFPEVRIEWVVMGQGEMVSQPSTESPSRITYMEESMKEVVDDFSSQKKKTKPKRHSSESDESELMELLQEESIYRQALTHLGQKQIEIRKKEVLSPEEQKALIELDSEIIEIEAVYLAAVYSRMTMEKDFMRAAQEARTTIYRVVGKPDPKKTYGGLLSHRLDISEQTAEHLVATGKIRAVFIEGEGHRVSEQAVRQFLGEA